MNRLEFKSGGQPVFNRDFRLQFENLYKAIEDQYKNQGAFILSGCEVTGSTISPGLVYIDGKILEFAGKSEVSFPAYLRMASPVYHEERMFVEDAANKTTRVNYFADLVGIPPTSGEYIVVESQGGTRILTPVVMESNYKEITSSKIIGG
ncbi:hypothetical protein [uncultured Microscilla sp.]|uniref:hypothetical protein n=1 Tax=uncultured Microscilla sp. TaxID=432653 RepID=UPI00262AF425|nr:hypothetical protein [uncultured Microscilla sp.]